MEVGEKHFFFPEMSITLVTQLSVLPVKEVSHQYQIRKLQFKEAPTERNNSYYILRIF